MNKEIKITKTEKFLRSLPNPNDLNKIYFYINPPIIIFYKNCKKIVRQSEHYLIFVINFIEL